MEDITKKLFVQTPVLLIGATLLIIGALGYWPFSDPPLQIQEPIINWILIMVGFLSMGSGIVELRHLRKSEVDELQLTRFQKELNLKSEALTSQQELQKMQEEYFKQQNGQISRQLEEIKSELLNKNENLSELRQQYALTLLHQKVELQIAKQESERIFEEYSDNYWSLYRILGQEGLIDLNISIEEVQDLDEGSVQKLLLLQFRNAFGLKSMLILSELLKGAGLSLGEYKNDSDR